MKFGLELVSPTSVGATGSGGPVFRHSGMFEGCPLTVTYELEIQEHCARRAEGVGPLTDEKLLAGLLSLPESDLGPVPGRFVNQLTEGDSQQFLAVLLTDPNGRLWGQRRVGVPVRVLEIEARAKDWSHGRALAHRWVGYAARTVWVDRPIDRDRPILLTEASHFGIGVVAGEQKDRLLAPSPYRPRRWTSARWLLAELVYEQFCIAQNLPAM